MDSKRWTLVVFLDLECTGKLLYEFEDGIVCKVPLPTAQTTLMLALAVCRALDDLEGNDREGSRGLSELGKFVGSMPGTGNEVLAKTIEGCKARIIKRVKLTLADLSRRHGRPMAAPDPIVRAQYAHGYRVPDEGIHVVGVDIAELADGG